MNTLVKTALNSMINNHTDSAIYIMIFSCLYLDNGTIDFIIRKALSKENFDMIYTFSLKYDLSDMFSLVNKGVLIEPVKYSLLRQFIINRVDMECRFFVCNEKELNDMFKCKNISINSSLNLTCSKQRIVVYDEIMLFEESNSFRFIDHNLSKLIEKNMFDIDLMKQQSQGRFDLYEYILQIDKFKLNSSYIEKSYKLIKMLNFREYTEFQMIDLMNMKFLFRDEKKFIIYRFSQIIDFYFIHKKYLNLYKIFTYMLESSKNMTYLCHLWVTNFISFNNLQRDYFLSNERVYDILKLQVIYNMIRENPSIPKYDMNILLIEAKT